MEDQAGLRSIGVYIVIAFVLVGVAVGGLLFSKQQAYHSNTAAPAPISHSTQKPDAKTRQAQQSTPAPAPDSKPAKPDSHISSTAPDASPRQTTQTPSQVAVSPPVTPAPVSSQTNQPVSSTNGVNGPTAASSSPVPSNSRLSYGLGKVPDTGPPVLELMSTGVLMSVAVYLAVYIVHIKLSYKRYRASKFSRGATLYF